MACTFSPSKGQCVDYKQSTLKTSAIAIKYTVCALLCCSVYKSTPDTQEVVDTSDGSRVLVIKEHMSDTGLSYHACPVLLVLYIHSLVV